MSMRRGILQGKKTYVLAVVAVIGALAGWLTGDLSLAEALNTAWLGGVAAAGRSAIKAIE